MVSGIKPRGWLINRPSDAWGIPERFVESRGGALGDQTSLLWARRQLRLRRTQRAAARRATGGGGGARLWQGDLGRGAAACADLREGAEQGEDEPGGAGALAARAVLEREAADSEGPGVAAGCGAGGRVMREDGRPKSGLDSKERPMCRGSCPRLSLCRAASGST